MRKIPLTEQRKQFLTSINLNPQDVNVWRKKWQRLIYHAGRRDLLCLLSFEQYVNLAAKAGLTSPMQIGTSMHSYQLARYGDVGNYSVDNCRFVLRDQNILEWKENGGRDAMAEKHRSKNKETHPSTLAQSIKVSKNFEVTSPSGEVFTGLNLSDFCKLHGLNRGNMANVCRGTMKSYKGWTGKYI